MKQSRGEKVFAVFNYIILFLLAIATFYPFWEVIKISFSTPAEANSMTLSLWPKVTSISAYQHVISNEYIWMGYKNTMIRMIIGVSIQLILMTLTAYPLSKKYFPNKDFWTLLIVFTMFFHGGLIPNYLLVTKTLMIGNTIWALVLPGAISTFSMIIMRNNFMALPESLEESAKIDGAGQLTVLMRIVLPLSMPIIMTVALWDIVGHWNAWFDCLIYIRDSKKYVLQAVLRKIIIDAAPQFTDYNVVVDDVSKPSPEIVKCATIIVSSLPIMLIYPFIQKYFIKGVMVGSLKG